MAFALFGGTLICLGGGIGAVGFGPEWIFLICAFVLFVFLMSLSTYCVLFCGGSIICGNCVRKDYLLFSRELEYDAIASVKYEQTDVNRGAISIFAKEESIQLRIYCEYFNEENDIWKKLCEKVNQSTFELSAQQRLEEIKEIRIHGPKPFSWKRFFTEPIVRQYGKK